MKYLGSKNRVARQIVPLMLREARRHGIKRWVEPFVGGGNIIDKIPPSFERTGIDINPHAINALIAIRDFPSRLPEIVSEEYFNQIRNDPPDPIKSWIRFTCAFAGIFNGTFARDKTRTNYAIEGKGKAPSFKGLGFSWEAMRNSRKRIP